MIKKNQKLKFIDLFCGIGGFRIAFEKNGCECVFSSDIDKYARETYNLNFGEYPKGDITKIKSSEIPDFDILCAGFPCQPFSIAGKRLGFEDTRGTLFFEVARIIKDKKPKAFFLENVSGLTNHNGGKTLNVIVNTLEQLGYNVSFANVNAKDCGMPQNRNRWYCVGFRKDLINCKNTISFDIKIHNQYDLSSVIQENNEKRYACSEVCLRNIEKYIELKNIEIDKYTLAYDIRPSRCNFSNNLISPCLTAKMGTGGNNIPVVVVQKRRLTEKECLKIMGFPDDYKISNGLYSYKQIGNSVVVPVLEEIARQITNVLWGVLNK